MNLLAHAQSAAVKIGLSCGLINLMAAGIGVVDVEGRVMPFNIYGIFAAWIMPRRVHCLESAILFALQTFPALMPWPCGTSSVVFPGQSRNVPHLSR